MSGDDRIGAERPSGFQTLTGYRLSEWADGHAVMTLDMDARHENRNGFLHGGIVMTLLDATCGYAVTWCRVPGHVRRCVTVSLNVNFLASVHDGALRCVATARGGGRRIVSATGELFGPDGQSLAIGQAAFRYLPGSESPDGIPLAEAEAGARAHKAPVTSR